MAMIQCGFCKQIHPHTKPCRPAEKAGITKQQLVNGEVDLQTGEVSKPTKASETVKRSEKDSQQRSDSQSYDKNAAQRARRWQQNNPERYREYRREYMRQYRQRKRVDSDSNDQ